MVTWIYNTKTTRVASKYLICKYLNAIKLVWAGPREPTLHGRLRWSLGTQCQSFRKSDYGRSRIQRNGTYARAGRCSGQICSHSPKNGDEMGRNGK